MASNFYAVDEAIKYIHEIIKKPACDRSHIADFTDILYDAADKYGISIGELIDELNAEAKFTKSLKESKLHAFIKP